MSLPWLDTTCLGMLMLKTSDIAIDRKKLYSQVCLCCGLKGLIMIGCYASMRCYVGGYCYGSIIRAYSVHFPRPFT